jgi:hypothetical protein
MRALLMLVPVAIACCASAGDAFRAGNPMPFEARIESRGDSRPAEASLRQITVTVNGKTSHGLQVIVRDPVTGVFWSDALRSTRAHDVQQVRRDWYGAFRFAASDTQLAAFHLHPPFLDATISTRRAPSLAAAEELTLDEIRRDLESTWPITDGSPKEPVRVNLESAFGRGFIFDGELHPTLRTLSVAAIAFHEKQWVVTIRNEQNETGQLVFSETLEYLPAKTR